jgi:DNA-directed RNA polymerase specialized sigma24 family protein
MAFPTTQWSVLAGATLHGDSAGREALARFCAAYRVPVRSYLEGRGMAREDAEDLTQDFFFKLLQSRAWRRAEQVKGRFRSFLLGILHHVMQHQSRHQTRLKRGGGISLASLDELADAGVELPAVDDAAAVSCFDREWALSLVQQVLAEVRAEFVREGRDAEFAVLRRFLPGAPQPPAQAEAARELRVSETALRTSIHRLRQRFRDRLRAAVSATVSAPHEVDEELRYLGAILMRKSDQPR